MTHRIQGLDIARSAAILGVILAHFMGSTWLRIFGLLGVELFFALSGYLIGRILFRQFQERPDDESLFVTLKRFWVRRWMRTLPAYFTVLTLEALAWYFIWRGGLNDLPKYLVFLQNFLSEDMKYFFVSWSLSVEEWFYLLFAVLVAITLVRRSKRQIVFEVCFGVWFLLFMAIRYHYAEREVVAVVRSLVVCRLDSIACGVLLAYILHFYPSVTARLKSRAMMGVGVGLVGVGTWLANDVRPGFVTITYLLLPAAFALTLPFLGTIKIPSGLMSRVIERISQLSYSLYLVHMLVFMVCDHFFFDLYSNVVIKIAFRLTALLCSVGIAGLIYRFIEKPGMEIRDKYFPDGRAPVSLAGRA